MKIFFTSDTHFNQERTLTLSKRPFQNITEMNEQMIHNWNTIVGKNDIVYHLGDFGDLEIANALNGNIKMVLGNYERDEYEGVPSDYVQELFSNMYNIEALDTGYELDIDWKNVPHDKSLDNIIRKIILTHEPMIESKPTKETGIFNLFGHIHGLQMIKPYGLNVGVDSHYLTPIDLESVLFWANGIVNHYDKYVFK